MRDMIAKMGPLISGSGYRLGVGRGGGDGAVGMVLQYVRLL